MDDERALVERARSDPDAFGDLYRRYVERVHAFALRRTGSRAAAEDVTAATFERALTKLERFGWSDGGFAPWLFRLAANEVAEHHRRGWRHRSPRAQRTLGRFAHDVAEDAPETSIVVDDEHRAVRVALDTLRPRHQRVLTLTYFTDLDRDQVVAALGISRGVYAVALHRATKALADAMEEPR